KSLNVFELPYVYLLVTGLFYFARKQKKMMWWIVTTSYVLIFSLWLVFYMIVYK
ncbi:MAG TPA: sulfate ABC transporter permease, partial [Cytophagales bacterium]|nr:sulfate ABC transporter permease [Cytophagales bacterium]